MRQKLWISIAACISLGSLTACNDSDVTGESIADSQLIETRPKPIDTPGQGNINNQGNADIYITESVDESAVVESTVDTSVTEEPTVDTSVTEEPTVDTSVTEEPTVDTSVTEEPTVDTSVTEEPTVDTPVAEESNTTVSGELLPPYQALPLYSADSVWNQTIPSEPAIDAESAVMIDALVTAARTGYDPTLNVKQWSVPVYVADADTPRYSVKINGSNTQYGFQAMIDVPIPDGAAPDPQRDGHMVIMDIASGYEYDFWRAQQNADGSWEAAWGNRISLDSNGIFPTGSGAKASGFAAMAGIIWPEEFEQGRIDHALFMALPIAASGGFVYPATASDGWVSTTGAIPEGAHLQLDPSLDLDQFEMEPYERIIAEALQNYGAYVGDYSGAVSLYAINPQSYPENPYPAGWFDSSWTDLKGIPWEHMRVLEMGEQGWGPTGVADFSIYLMAN